MYPYSALLYTIFLETIARLARQFLKIPLTGFSIEESTY